MSWREIASRYIHKPEGWLDIFLWFIVFYLVFQLVYWCWLRIRWYVQKHWVPSPRTARKNNNKKRA